MLPACPPLLNTSYRRQARQCFIGGAQGQLEAENTERSCHASEHSRIESFSRASSSTRAMPVRENCSPSTETSQRSSGSAGLSIASSNRLRPSGNQTGHAVEAKLPASGRGRCAAARWNDVCLARGRKRITAGGANPVSDRAAVGGNCGSRPSGASSFG